MAAILGLLLVALIGVGLYAKLLFDPNDYKQHVITWVKQHTGRDLTIKGRIKLSLFPWLAVDIGRMSLADRKGFGPQPFARVSRIRLGIRLLPILINKEIETKTVTLEGLTLNLAVDKSGRVNWGDLMPARRIADTSGNLNDERSERKVGQGVDRYLSGLAIGGVRIEHAAVHWDDEAEGRHIAVTKFNLESGSVLPRHPFPLTLRFDLQARPAAIRSHVAIHGIGVVEPLKGSYRIDDFHIATETWGKNLPVSPLDAKLRGKLAFDLETKELYLSHMVAQAFGATATGRLKAIQLLDVPAMSGKLELKGLDLRRLINLVRSNPIITRDSDVLGAATAKINFDANGNHLDVSYLHTEFDDTIMNGIIDVRDFKHPFTSFEFYLDQVDMDRYLPPPASDDAAPATPGALAVAGAGGLPLNVLRALDLDGKVQVGRLKVAALHLHQARVAIQAKDGRITLRPEASLYGGSYRGNIHVDARSAPLKLSFDESLKGVELAPLLQDAAGSDPVSGKADVRARFSVLGDPARLLRSLNGRARFELTDGAIHGINVAHLVREAGARLQGRSPKGGGQTLQTDFSALSGTLRADNGVLRNSDLTAKTPFLRLAGRGALNLVTQAVDYRLDAKIVDSLEGQGGQDLREMRGLTVPIHVGGTISRLVFAPDLKELARSELGKRLQKELRDRLDKQGRGDSRKPLEELKHKLQKNLDKLLRP